MTLLKRNAMQLRNNGLLAMIGAPKSFKEASVTYEIVKTLHLASMVSWFAGLFYLPRLFVYHADAKDQISHERFVIMERKLYRGIMTPAMIATIIFGIWLAALNWNYFKTQGWFHAKMLLVLLLVGYHHICLAHLKRFAIKANTRTHVYFRWFNEVPVLFLLLVIGLVIIRPF